MGLDRASPACQVVPVRHGQRFRPADFDIDELADCWRIPLLRKGVEYSATVTAAGWHTAEQPPLIVGSGRRLDERVAAPPARNFLWERGDLRNRLALIGRRVVPPVDSNPLRGYVVGRKVRPTKWPRRRRLNREKQP